MIVEKLNIFNFRSFDHSGMIYDLKKGMDTIVGENGSGKSNIVSAFKAFSEMPGTNQIFNKEDYFEGNTNNPIKLQMNISLVDKDILFLIRELDIDMIVQDLEEVFGKDLFIEIVYYNNRSKYLNFKIGNIFLYEGGASKLNLVNTTVIDYSSSPTLRSFQSNTVA